MAVSRPDVTGSIQRIRSAAIAARRAPTLEVDTRVLLACAEAASILRYPLGPVAACAIADKVASEIFELRRPASVRSLVAEALASAGLATLVRPSAITRITWRLVFDLWGGPGS